MNGRFSIKQDDQKQPVTVISVDWQTDITGRPVTVECLGRGWYVGQTKYCGAAYVRVANVALDDLEPLDSDSRLQLDRLNENAPIPVSALSTFKIEQLATAILADISRSAK